MTFPLRLAFLLIALITLAVAISPVQAVESNLQFGGTLVSDPCDLDPETTDLEIDFGSVIEKDLYLHTRTQGVPVVINLINCDTTLGDAVSLTFKGTENSALPGMLAVTGTAAGIGIALETQDGSPLPFNRATPSMTLAQGNNSIALRAYVTGEPEAIKNQTMTPGDFSAIATFEMEYN
ncbi:fimbrial protein [Siccibacter colletis]|uniref:fimbrial protein n=1 Tax=Siccibacter colletis TaxID=1505757 RepID=UPI0028BD43B0|nr:fimbrial protein [Siccibacter colletis]WNN49339.1 fimbrial protein [Siccibacter colletis]